MVGEVGRRDRDILSGRLCVLKLWRMMRGRWYGLGPLFWEPHARPKVIGDGSNVTLPSPLGRAAAEHNKWALAWARPAPPFAICRT